MIENGGTYHHYQRSHTKFVIASCLPDVKIRSTSLTKNIVKPEWIADSLRENRVLDYSNYLLHTKKNSAQPQISFKKAAVPKTEEENVALKLEELNSKLQQDDIKTGTAVDNNFLQEFLNNSRLHHISTLSSGFKFHITDLRKKHDGMFPERELLKTKLQQVEDIPKTDIIMHIDMDCFFVSVGLKKNPHLKGFPIAVTHSKGKNENASSQEEFHSMAEIASCSYEARAKGLKNGMFVGAALKLCPELKTIPYDFEEYRKTAFILYDTVAKYTLDIEAVSCDELYADLKALIVDCKIDVMDFITLLRQEIFIQTGCTCSVGIGANRLQARLATKKAKPNGQFELLTIDIKEFMKDKKITDLPGIGFSTAMNLEKIGIQTCGQLQETSLHVLQNRFGKKSGETMSMMAKGLDDRKLIYEQTRKSVSVDINYGIRFNDEEEVKRFLRQICEELSKRLIEIERKGKCITLKIMMRAKGASIISKKFLGFGEADKVSKSSQLMSFTNDPMIIFGCSISLLDGFKIPPHDLRGIGIQVSKLDDEKHESGGKLLEMFKKISENPNAKPINRVKVEPTILIKREVSPRKRKEYSPKKKGRPVKRVKSNNTSSVAEMFTANKPPALTGQKKLIDPDILAELPADIVEEILREYDVSASTSNNTHEVDDLKNQEECAIEENLSENIFMQGDWRAIIKSWIDIKEEIDEESMKISDSLTQLVRVKNLELLFIIMRFLHRNIKEAGKESWRVSYKHIFYENLQDEMKRIYDRKLSAPYDFK